MYNVEHTDIWGWLNSVLSSVLGSSVLDRRNICASGIVSSPKMEKIISFFVSVTYLILISR